MSQENQQQDGLPKVDQAKANDASIVKGHARVRREGIAGSPVAFFMLVAFLLVITYAFFAGRRHFHHEKEGQQYLYDREQIYAFKNQPVGPVVEVGPDGAKLYAQYCVACHQATGLGLPGAFPPLAGSEWVKEGDGNVPIRVVLSGLTGPITVKGESYNGAMPGLGVLKDDQIAAIVTYIRESWDNGAEAVTPEMVAEIRAEVGSRGNWTEAEIKAFF